MTALDVITAALLRINAIAPGENPTAAEGATGLATLHDMLDAWMIERLMLWAIQRLVFPLTAGKQSYTVGPGGDFNIPRPVKIDRMGILSFANSAQPMELPIVYLTVADWNRVPVKNIQSSLPVEVWDDGDFPLRTMNFWAIPNGAIPVSAVLYVWAQLQQFVDLSTDYQFPPGYTECLKYNLAYRLSAEFGGFMPPILPGLALEAKARIKALNTPLLDLRCDDALVGTGRRMWNWLTDTPAAGSR